MARWQGRSLTKPSGGRIWPSRKRRKRERGGVFTETKIGPAKQMIRRVSGGGKKSKLFAIDVANVIDIETGLTKQTKILSVIENPADPHFVRRNTLTRGAIIETELGRARVTSRPGQVGMVNAVLIKAKR